MGERRKSKEVSILPYLAGVFMNVGDCKELFLFASKAGSLEGYLYERAKTEPLKNWIDNIDDMYKALPDNVKNEINEVYVPVLRKILQYGENVLDDLLKKKLKRMISLAEEYKLANP